jgi:peptide-methionine (S)-S-oxide reductase
MTGLSATLKKFSRAPANQIRRVMSAHIQRPIRPKTSIENSRQNEAGNELAYLGGGPFWCLEAIFKRVPGVVSVASGFTGGKTENPTYYEVCTKKTGHSEIIQIETDPTKISYEKLLEIFWQAHDPTPLNSAFEVGPQYGSIIFYRNENQKLMAELSKARAWHHFTHPIVTRIVPFKKFYEAEIRHQEYYDNNPDAPYCQLIIAPRLQVLENKGVISKQPVAKFLSRSQTA